MQNYDTNISSSTQATFPMAFGLSNGIFIVCSTMYANNNSEILYKRFDGFRMYHGEIEIEPYMKTKSKVYDGIITLVAIVRQSTQKSTI